MSRMTQNMPALGNSRGVNYTNAEMSKDLQVYHLSCKHHPNQVYDSMYIAPNADRLTLSTRYSSRTTLRGSTVAI